MTFPELAEEQLKAVIHSGNDVQLHIHPHWYMSDYVNGEWYVNKDYYRLHAFSDINEIIFENKRYLCELLIEENKNYKCVAFRAGGFCIQPEKELLRVLKNNGFMIDSSVCSGRRCKDVPYNFDYRKISSRTAWRFDIEQGFNSEISADSNSFIEIPIVTSKIGISKIKLFLEKMSPSLPPNRGKYINQLTVQKKDFVWDSIHLMNRFLFDPYLCEFDSADYKRMINIIEPYIASAEQEDKIMAVIGHPKMSWDGWFYHIECFLDIITTDYADTIKTITMQEAYQILKNEK